MSRIRTIKPEFFLDDELAELPPLTRLLFIGLWTLADCEGRLEDRPKRIRAQILPFDDGDTDAMLQSLHDCRFIHRYTIADNRYLIVTNFKKHQRLSGKEAETDSNIPPPSPESIQLKAISARGSNGEATGKQRGSNGEAVNVQEGKGRERKGKEGKGREEERAHAETAHKDTPSAPTLKGSRLSLEVLPSNWQSWAERERPDLDPQRTFDTFRDYWIGKPGADGMKLDWFATWRNWVRRERAQTGNTTPRNGTPQKLLTPEQDEWHKIINGTHSTHGTTCKIIEGEVIHEAH